MTSAKQNGRMLEVLRDALSFQVSYTKTIWRTKRRPLKLFVLINQQNTMSSKDESFRSFSYDDELDKACWFKEDPAKGGWREAKKLPGSTFWIKTFPDKEMPTKTLFECHMPLSGEQFIEVMSPRNMEYRKKWDKVYVANEILEEYPDGGGHVIANKLPLLWPFSDREFVLFIPPAKEVEWYGKPAFLTVYKNLSHPSKPTSESSYVRVTNGGQFFITPDEKNPENACTVFGLSHNSFNGFIPHSNTE